MPTELPGSAPPPELVAGSHRPALDRPATRDPRPRQRRNARRALAAVAAVALAEVIGTVGFHLIEGAGWINAFYFESMLATGQGPPFSLNTNAGKIFASIMAFVSVGSTLSAVVFTLGPLLARAWRDIVADLESGARRAEREIVQDVRQLEEELR